MSKNHIFGIRQNFVISLCAMRWKRLEITAPDLCPLPPPFPPFGWTALHHGSISSAAQGRDFAKPMCPLGYVMSVFAQLITPFYQGLRSLE